MAEKEVPTKEAEESMRRIFALHKVRIEAQEKLEAAEAEVKLLRRSVEKAQRMVNEAINEEGRPSLFSAGVVLEAGDLESARKKLLDEEAKAEPVKSVAGGAVVGGSEAWRAVLTENLEGLPGKAIGVLKTWQHNGKHAGLDTLGGLVDWKTADRWFTDVKGIGKAAAEKIDNAIVAYFEKNPVAAAPEAKPAVEQAATMTAEQTAAIPVAEAAPPPPQPEAPAKKKRTSKKAEAAK